MYANEFVKKFGWDKAKEIIAKFHNNELQSCCFDSGLINGEDKSWWDICVYDLKRLVESHELVEACGGVNVVKRHLKEGNVFRFEEKPLMRQALADVESC